jgi:Zn-dependent peptidase ImmA (M78 family)
VPGVGCTTRRVTRGYFRAIQDKVKFTVILNGIDGCPGWVIGVHVARAPVLTSKIRKSSMINQGESCGGFQKEIAGPFQRSNVAGVALALVKPLQKTALSGAAWWLSARKAVIQLSARHKTDDHLWFTFFHEAAHILLHSKKSVFVDGEDADNTAFEAEASEWACNTLVAQRDWEQFVKTAPLTKAAVQRFAEEQGIAPGIVVGMLQHKGQIPWTDLNGLKVKLEPQEAE